MLVYSTNMKEHLKLLDEVFNIYQSNQLFAKRSLCWGKTDRILGVHNIRRRCGDGSKSDRYHGRVAYSKKCQGIQRILGVGPLGDLLNGSISKPLTELLKKG